MVFPCYNGEELAERGWQMKGKRCIIPVPHSRRGRWVLFAAVSAALVLAAALFLLNKTETRVNRKTPEGLNRYEVNLRLNTDEHTLGISETLRFRNDTGETLDELVMRTWLNAYETEDTSPAALDVWYDDCYYAGFSPGFLQVQDVIWNGERAESAYSNADKTALSVFIPPLKPGEEGTLLLRCVAALPACAGRCGYVGADYQLGNVIPLVSRWENGEWRKETYSPVGDPFLSDCADFQLSLSIPADYAWACSVPLTREKDGFLRGSAQALRDVALCVSPDYCLAEGRANGIPIRSLAKTRAGAARALQDARQALETFEKLYGAYPYPAYTVCSADVPFGGMEYSALSMVSQSNYLEEKAETLELVIAHETAHQWFYGLVGSDQALQPWQDEAASEYATLRYVRERYGESSFETLKYYRVDAPLQERLPGTLTPGSPIDYFSSLTDYSTVVYGRGAALFLALDEMLPGGVDAFLRAYADAFSYQFASRAQFEAFLNRYAGMDLRPLLMDYLDTAMDD